MVIRKDGTKRFTIPAGNPHDATGLHAAMRRYLEHRAVIGCTEQGRFNTERYIRDFIIWADARSVTHPQHVSHAVLERYQRWLYYYRKEDGAPLASSSQRSKIVPLRGFFKWLTRKGELPANPASELDLPKNVHRLPACVLTVSEVDNVLAGADTGTLVGLRDRAVMEVLYSTGLRRMEITQLIASDIDHERGVILVRQGKGRKDRLIPIGERALHWVDRYAEEVRPEFAWNNQECALFIGAYGEALSMSYLSTTVSRYVKKAEIGKHGGCHLFRHTMATQMLEGGADIRYIQAMLGHADLTTTQIYTQVAIKQLQLVHTNTHPGALLRVRGEPDAANGITPSIEQNEAISALYAALDAEAAEEKSD
eukprot:gene1840-2163_t